MNDQTNDTPGARSARIPVGLRIPATPRRTLTLAAWVDRRLLHLAVRDRGTKSFVFSSEA